MNNPRAPSPFFQAQEWLGAGAVPPSPEELAPVPPLSGSASSRKRDTGTQSLYGSMTVANERIRRVLARGRMLATGSWTFNEDGVSFARAASAR